METINYYRVIEDSQFYTDLDMIIQSIKIAVIHASDIKQKDENHVLMKSSKEELEYILKGLENTKKQNYKLTKNDE